jgi:hypothetical protein
MKPRDIIERFDAYLLEEELRLEAVVIGGAALALLGITNRQTKDCDILQPTLSAELVEAAQAFARAVRADGEELADDWLNNGPASLAPTLPEGWEERLQLAFQGDSILLRSLGRGELLRSKLFALCDRGIDLGDCLALAPTARELREATPWVEWQDANPDWPEHVRSVLDDLGRRLGHGAS